jgi:L-alanine-DL-glutamate epimerase-like enolase superfamily enzyme
LNIAKAEIYGYELSYRHGDYVMSGGQEVRALQSTVVRLCTDQGAEGWGEVCPLGPRYLESHAGGARAALELMLPALIGADGTNLGDVHDRLNGALRGHAYAKSAVDIACWDLLGQATGQDAATLLGGRRQESFGLYCAIPLAEPEAMRDAVEAFREQGIRRFQVKVGNEPEQDVRRVRAVHEELRPGELIIADANGGWCLQDAVIAVNRLEGMPQVLLEEPCRTLDECLHIRRLTRLPMVLDEVITDIPTLLRAHREGGMEAINLKLSKFAGLSGSRRVRDLAAELGLRLTIEDTWGGDLTTAAVSALAASTPAQQVLTVSFMNDWVNEHIAGYQPRSERGMGAAPTGPGLGIRVDRRMLDKPLLAFG